MTSDKDLRAARLKEARLKAGFDGPTEAAERFGWPVVTYLSHENTTRGIRPAVAKKYAKAFNVSASWLITGEGPMAGPGIDAELMELPPDVSDRLIRAMRQMIAAVKPLGKVR